MSITATVIILYLGFFAAFGIYLNRNNSTASDWAIGGGNLGIFMLAAGVAGTRIGGAGTYGVAGDVISEGLGHLWYGANSFAALFWWACFLRFPIAVFRLSVWVRSSTTGLVPIGANGLPAFACRLSIWS